MAESSPLSRATPTNAETALPDHRITIAERAGLGLATLQARKGQGDALREAIRQRYGVELPHRPARVGTAAVAFVGLGPDYWLAIAENDDHRLATSLKATIGSTASIVDQSGGYVVFRVGGPAVRDVLAKGFPIDLHERAFPIGAAATTVAAHIGASIWRNDDQDGYASFDIAVFRSLSRSFRRWFSEAAAEFGCEVRQ